LEVPDRGFSFGLVDSNRSRGANTWSANRQEAGLAAEAARRATAGGGRPEGEST